MTKKVSLKEVTAKNWEAVADLALGADQVSMVESNLFSIAESHFDPEACPRAVQAGNRIVGFLMYDVHRRKGKAPLVSIYRFMIDRKYQGKGYGRAALAAALKEIRAIPGIKNVSVQYMPENRSAKTFYSSFGFVEVGRDAEGEVIAELKF